MPSALIGSAPYPTPTSDPAPARAPSLPAEPAAGAGWRAGVGYLLLPAGLLPEALRRCRDRGTAALPSCGIENAIRYCRARFSQCSPGS